jgi:hypothetical protein
MLYEKKKTNKEEKNKKIKKRLMRPLLSQSQAWINAE